MNQPNPTDAHLTTAHPLAEVAARHCRHHRTPRLGGIACGMCWELAIRDDERFVVECDLPRELDIDPGYIDEIAVDLACRGERIALTTQEQVIAVQRLTARGLSPFEIARRLQIAYRDAVALIAPKVEPSAVGDEHAA